MPGLFINTILHHTLLGMPGEPATYCPSDCGVSQIVAPSYIGSVIEEPTTQAPGYLWFK